MTAKGGIKMAKKKIDMEKVKELAEQFGVEPTVILERLKAENLLSLLNKEDENSEE